LRQEGYILLMLKQLSARGCLFMFVRTHHHLGYYFKVVDTRLAANQARVLPAETKRLAKVVEIHPVGTRYGHGVTT
jgi:hypothetical protein